MPHPKVKISDDSGNTVDVTSNRLDVNAYLNATPTIDIGDVSLLLGGTAASTNAGTMDAQTLRVTLATDDTHWGTVGTVSASDGTAHAQLRYIGDVTANLQSFLSTIDSDTGFITDLLGYALKTLGTSTYTEGSTYGNSIAAVRNDDLAALAGTDNEFAPFQVNSIGGLYVTGSEVENAAVQSEPLLIGGRYDSSARTLGDGDAGAVALNASGHVLMTIEGAVINDDSQQTSTPPMVNVGGEYRAALGAYANGDATILLSDLYGRLRIAGNHVDDDGFTLGSDSGIMIMGFAGNQSVDTNDAAALQCDTSGRLMVEIDSTSIGTSTCFRLNGAAWDNVDIGVGVYAVRNDTLVALSNVADGDYTPFQVAAEGALYTTHGVTGGADGVTTDDTNGTVLGGDVICQKIDIQAQTDNTGVIAVGFTGVDATIATGTGIILYPGDTYSLEINNLNLIYIESSVNGEGVRYTYFT